MGMSLPWRCRWCSGARYLDCHICDGTGTDCPLCVGGKAPCGCAQDVHDGAHAYAEYGVSRLGVIWLGAHRRCRRIHAAVDRAADVLAGPTDRRATLGIIVSTYVAGRSVWYPADARELVAAGLIAEDGPVEHFADRRWYRPADRKPHDATKEGRVTKSRSAQAPGFSRARWWCAGGCYTAIGVPLAVGIASAILHSRELLVVATVLAFVGFAVNVAYVVPLGRLLAARRAMKRAQRERI